MIEILKSYGIYYIEVDLVTGKTVEFIKGSLQDIADAFQEIMVKGLLER